MTDKITEAIKALKKARQILTPRKMWNKGVYDTGETVCAMGALGRAMYGNYNDHHLVDGSCAHQFLRKGIGVVKGNKSPATSVEGFNDHPKTTHAMVLSAFDEAIRHAEKLAKAPTKPPKGAITR